MPICFRRRAVKLGLGMLCACMISLPTALAGPARPEPAARPIDRAVQLHASGHTAAAKRAFERLARKGDPVAHYNLAVIGLQAGARGAALQTAVRHMTIAAQAGFVTAQFGLAQLHDAGGLGTPDPVQALTWYRRAAASGSVAAAEEVGTAYYLGRGVARDPAEALHWYRIAAGGGEVGAQYLLASMFEQGEGTPPDLRLAAYWYDIAARNGDIAAPLKLKAVLARLNAPNS